MVTQGSFKYTVNGENKSKEEIDNMDLSNMNCTIDGLIVSYFYPAKKGLPSIFTLSEEYNQKSLEEWFNKIEGSTKKETIRTKTEEILEEVERHQQEVNGGILKGEEFPHDFTNKDFEVVTRREKATMQYLQGIKETEGKLHYELSWEFIEEMAKRMAGNKSDKYPLYNWKKSINVQDLKDAINRHHIEVMKGNYKDGEEILGHIVSYACNSMMLWEQLNKNKFA